MRRADIDICLQVQGPFLTKSSAPGDYGVDAVLARDAEGRPYIAGTHIVGKLRQAWEEITCALDDTGDSRFRTSDRLGDAARDWRPKTKALYFSDFVLAGDAERSGVRYRIRMDAERGAARQGAYLLVDNPFACGEPLFFRGTLTVFVPSDAEVEKLRNDVEAGLKWVTQLGGYRSIGFGRMLDVTVRRPRVLQIPTPDGDAQYGECFDLLVHPRSPFCIADKPVARNLFESREEIPGAAMLGAIAATWCALTGAPALGEIRDPARAQLKEHFDRIRLTHALPSRRWGSRPVVPPLSLVKVDAAAGCFDYFDVALQNKPGLIHGRAPAFAVDWKSRGEVDRDFGWPRLDRELRVRTAIDASSLRSKTNQLFAYDTVVPGEARWCARVDLADVPQDDRAAVAGQLASLLEHGVAGFGKTKAVAATFAGPRLFKSARRSSLEPRDGCWVVTLQTPALLLGADAFERATSRVDLLAAYRKTWHELSDGALRLERFFARQSLSGGEYLYHRFQGNGDYKPYVLSAPGSAFVLQAAGNDESAAQSCIERWWRHGLGLPKTVRVCHGITGEEHEAWQQCPYIRQNGYGEIAVNLDVHWTHAPDAGAYQAIQWIGEENNAS